MYEYQAPLERAGKGSRRLFEMPCSLERGDGEAGKRQIGRGGWQKRSIKKRATAAPKEQETNEYPETKKSYDMMAKVYV